MNRIGQVHRALAEMAPGLEIDVLADEGVQNTIRREIGLVPPQRESPLHPSLIVWLMLGMALFRVDSIPNVFARLLARWRNSRTWISLRAVTDSALAHGRMRLGVLPLRRLFEATATRVNPEPSFHGLRVWSLDGTALAVADTPANARGFGRHHAARGRSAFPQLRLLTLTAVRTHEIRAAQWGPYRQSEASMTPDVVHALHEGDLVLLDRGFMSIRFYGKLADQGAAFVGRIRNGVNVRILNRRGQGDFDVEVRSGPSAKRNDYLAARVMVLRLIEYRVGRELVRLLTNLCADSIRAREIAALYHERWEVELSFDEIKTHFISVRHGTLDLPFRGRSPAMVEQELWAMLAAFNLVRRRIARAAKVHKIDPRRISFTDAVIVIVVTWQAGLLSNGNRRRADARLADDLAHCTLDRWRRPRRCPRLVRVKASPYGRKKPSHHEELHDVSKLLRMGRTKCA